MTYVLLNPDGARVAVSNDRTWMDRWCQTRPHWPGRPWRVVVRRG